MLSKALSDLVAHTVTTMSDRPTPTAIEILAAMNKLAEEAHRIGYDEGECQGYARGVVAGQKQTGSMFERIFGAQ